MSYMESLVKLPEWSFYSQFVSLTNKNILLLSSPWKTWSQQVRRTENEFWMHIYLCNYWLLEHYQLPCLYLKQRLRDWTLPPSSGTKPTELGPIYRASEISGPMPIDWAKLSTLSYLRMEVECSYRYVMNKNRTKDNVQKVIILLIYHRHVF
jgi:hypothetical protein